MEYYNQAPMNYPIIIIIKYVFNKNNSIYKGFGSSAGRFLTSGKKSSLSRNLIILFTMSFSISYSLKIREIFSINKLT